MKRLLSTVVLAAEAVAVVVVERMAKQLLDWAIGWILHSERTSLGE